MTRELQGLMRTTVGTRGNVSIYGNGDKWKMTFAWGRPCDIRNDLLLFPPSLLRVCVPREGECALLFLVTAGKCVT